MSDDGRRRFLAGLGLAPLATAAGSGATEAALAPVAEYMLDPRLIYLNTASLGPAPTKVFEATVAAWRELETNPVRMGYARDPDTTISAAVCSPVTAS